MRGCVTRWWLVAEPTRGGFRRWLNVSDAPAGKRSGTSSADWVPTTTTPPSTSSQTPNLADLIVKTPGVCSGQARIAGTRIKVKHVFTWVEQMGMSPIQVVAEYPHLNKAQVHAALAYYWCHQDEIQKDIENEDKLIAELKG
jgi:uncharacterized protein (DUF433 family)